MKLIKSNFLLGYFLIMLVISCSEESNNNNNKHQSNSSREDKMHKEEVNNDFSHQDDKINNSITKSILGIWEIDSIAENDTINKRVVKSFQGFAFKKDSSYAVGKKENGQINFKIVGSFSQRSDSLIILSKSGKVAMRYGLETIGENKMILRGNFEISSNIKRKPTLYLSKD